MPLLIVENQLRTINYSFYLLENLLFRFLPKKKNPAWLVTATGSLVHMR